MHRDLPDGPPVSGAPYWYWLGGRPALDFVNTRRERWRRDVECLLSVDEVVTWLVRAGLLPQPMRAPASVLAEARVLREAIDAGVRAAVSGKAPDSAAVALIDDWLALAGSRPALVTSAFGRPVLSERVRVDSPRRALGMVAYDAARMLGIDSERDPRPHLRLGHLLGAVLRPLARGRPPLVLDGPLRQPEQGKAIQGACAMSEVQSGLEGVVAFATEIAEPDREGGALRYRGIDIEDFVGTVPFEHVWGLLVDDRFEPGLPPAEPHPLAVRSGDPRVDVQSALAMLAPEWGLKSLIDISDEQARDDLARASVMALSFVAQSARGVGRRRCPSATSTGRRRSPSAS